MSKPTDKEIKAIIKGKDHEVKSGKIIRK